MQDLRISERIVTRIASVSGTGGSLLAPRKAVRNFWFDTLAFAIVVAFLMYVAWGMMEMSAPIGVLKQTPISLDISNLPEYAMRTTLRMLIAVLASLLFTLLYATAAAKSRKAGQIMIPILDVLQSVPVLGYISFTLTGFIALFPGSMLGVECAAIFAIFTSQAWNMTFSLYQSLKSVPGEMDEAANMFRLSGWQKFWKMELPFAMPGLVWNTMISMSGGWFFVVASEAITVGNQKITLPGIGSYIALAIEQRDLGAIGWAIATMTVVILLYDQLLFRPLVAWSDKFRYEMTASQEAPYSWVRNLFIKSRYARKLFAPVAWLAGKAMRLPFARPAVAPRSISVKEARIIDTLWYVLLTLAGLVAVWQVISFLNTSVTWQELGHVMLLALVTLLRVMVLIALASLVWVPLGVYIGFRPRYAQIVQPLAQFLAAFPANLFFPVAVMLISHYGLTPNIWLSPLMILGTQWYILFNVIAAASAFPNDLREVSRNLHVRGWLLWKRIILPGIFPYYLTGALNASGGAWNASIVSEVVSWGDVRYEAIGLGAYIANMTQRGDFAHTVLGVGVMALTVVLFNRFFWRPLYIMSAKKLRFD